MMCELPSNAILAEEFLEHFDGFSIGSNDLTQLTLGLDRDSGLVAESFDERDPAVKAMLAMAIRACRKHGKYVGICGQGPSDHPDLARWLMEQGIDSLSLNPDTVVSTWTALAEAARVQEISGCVAAAVFSRFHSFSFSVARLSCLSLPRPRPISSLMPPFVEMQVERDQGVAALLDLADQAPDLLGVQQQLARAGRVGRDVGRRGGQRRDVRADQQQLGARRTIT